MKLYELFTEDDGQLYRVKKDISIKKIETDSRKIAKGDLFVALRGKEQNGNGYIAEAFSEGAAAVVTDDAEVVKRYPDLPFVLVQNARIALSTAAARFYAEAHKKLNIIGVVGTNGKTSITYIVDAILKEFGKKTMVIGTLGVKIDDVRIDTGMTTPDPIALHKAFFDAWRAGVEYVVIEASAHAIYWKKLHGVHFSALIFTNFSEDHLDFFNTMDEYKSVKKAIFTASNARFAVVNADDAMGIEIINEKRLPTVTYGIKNPSDCFAVDIFLDGGIRFVANVFDDLREVRSHLYGAFNVYNLLAAITAARMLKVPMDTVCKAVSKLLPIPGRFNVIRQTTTVVIDYAHTPDGLQNVLCAARKITPGKLYSVFGCGGNRDRFKRPIMGNISGKIADFTIITSDNPRYEQPDVIMDDIEEGVEQVTKNYVCITERAKAIRYALSAAGAEDTVVIAGKGEENYIDCQGKKTFYMDKLVVEEFFGGKP